MNRNELDDLGTIFKNLPENIEHFTYFLDRDSNEMLLSSGLGDFEHPFKTLADTYQISDNENEELNSFAAGVFAMFFSLAERVDRDTLIEFKEGINIMIELYHGKD